MTYLLAGERVEVLIRWKHTRPSHDSAGHRVPGAPRNVLIRRADGTLTVRPFRGLRVER